MRVLNFTFTKVNHCRTIKKTPPFERKKLYFYFFILIIYQIIFLLTKTFSKTKILFIYDNKLYKKTTVDKKVIPHTYFNIAFILPKKLFI